MTNSAILYGVGVGPGDPALMTFRAAEILARVPVIAYVVDAHGRSMARDIAAGRIPATANELPLSFPMAPERKVRVAARADAARGILARLRAGESVAFIAEGDPLLYSTFQHLLAAMPPDVRVEVCPGVSALTASAASAVFPLAIEDESLLVAVGGAGTIARLSEWLEEFDVIVLFKVHRTLDGIVDALRRCGALGRAVLVERATQGDLAARIPLDAWDGTPPGYFSMVLVRGKAAP